MSMSLSVCVNQSYNRSNVYLPLAYIVSGKVMFSVMSVSQSVILSVHSGVPTIAHSSRTCLRRGG